VSRTSLVFAALLAASFAVAPGHTPEAPPSGSGVPAGPAPARSETANTHAEPGKTGEEKVDPQQDALGFLSGFLDKAGELERAPSVLFATLSDPVQTHLAASFDHDIAALQDGVQDSGFLFDSSWIPWDLAHAYSNLNDELDSADLRSLRHSYPGILLFRRKDAPDKNSDPDCLDKVTNVGCPDNNPYGNGLIVFIIAEKPTAGINITQVRNALHLLGSLAQNNPPGSRFDLKGPVLIEGPEFSGSLHSLIPVVKEFKLSSYPQYSNGLRIRSGSFTNSSVAGSIARQINDSGVSVDMGSAFPAFGDWTAIGLSKLEEMGIPRRNVAVLLEGESLFGESADSESEAGPSNLEFPRDISALRSSYEKQGLLDNPSAADIQKRALHLDSEDARSADSIRSYGQQGTVAAQESVLFGISEFLRAHGIHAVIIVATSEDDGYFLTRFLHANNPGVRVLIAGATRLFMRGPTAEFRGEMVISPFPLLPRQYDWTQLTDTGELPVAQDQTEQTFPNDSSSGVYYAVRDLLWDTGEKRLPRGYSTPQLEEGVGPLQPALYISAMGGGTAWPVSEKDEPPQRAQGSGSCPQGSGSSTPTRQLQMPFPFGCHLWQATPAKPAWKAAAFRVTVGSFWQLALWICIAVPAFYCFGVWYADPVRRRLLAYLQPPTQWEHWILLVTIPVLLTQSSFLLLARQMTYPRHVLKDSLGWLLGALFLSLAMPLMIVRFNRKSGERAGCFTPGEKTASRASLVFRYTIIAIWVIFAAFVAADLIPKRELPDVLQAYREMHWESGLSLIPSIMFLILAVSVWNYQALVGVSILRSRPHLPKFPGGERFSDRVAEEIAGSALPFPRGKEMRPYWWWFLVAAGVLLAVFWLWPTFRAITSLSAHWATGLLLALAYLAALLMILDIVQLVWVWSDLRDLLQVLNHRPFKRSFLSLREFNWRNLWSFVGGSLSDRYVVIARQFTCALEMKDPIVLGSEIAFFKRLGARYSKRPCDVKLGKYRKDLKAMHECFAAIGSRIAQYYPQMLAQVPDPEGSPEGPLTDDPFAAERRELEHLPAWLCRYESFLCLIYLAFIRVIMARLRTLALSIVSVFSLIVLAFAVYPFQPSLPLFITGAAALLVIAAVLFVVFSQMDRDPILARILQGDPTKLQWSFYAKYLDALALPLLTLLSSLLPGGAGRILELLRTAFSHGGP
jgi:hypothetical protein